MMQLDRAKRTRQFNFVIRKTSPFDFWCEETQVYLLAFYACFYVVQSRHTIYRLVFDVFSIEENGHVMTEFGRQFF
jgi:hypothetical protein